MNAGDRPWSVNGTQYPFDPVLLLNYFEKGRELGGNLKADSRSHGTYRGTYRGMNRGTYRGCVNRP